MPESSNKSEKNNVGTKGKSPKQDLTNAKDPTIELPRETQVQHTKN